MRKSGRQSPVCCQATNDPVNNGEFPQPHQHGLDVLHAHRPATGRGYTWPDEDTEALVGRLAASGLMLCEQSQGAFLAPRCFALKFSEVLRPPVVTCPVQKAFHFTVHSLYCVNRLA